WLTSDSNVATVVGNRLMAAGPGVVTVTASYGDTTASFIVKIVPNFAGRYVGGGPIVDCVDLSPGICASNVQQEKAGQPLEMFDLTLQQAKDAVSGRLAMRFGDGFVQGRIDDKGALSISGNLIDEPDLGNRTIIDSWLSHLEANSTVMFGTFGASLTR